MAARWIELVTGSLEQKKQYRQYKARIEALPEPYAAVAKALQRYLMYCGGVTDGDTIADDVRRLRRPLGARRRRRDARARDRRRRPGRVRRGVRRGVHRQALDRQGARPPDQGDRRRGARGAADDRRHAIRVQGLEKSYDDLHVLRGVDLDVARGSIVALLGSNGAGKTTVVKILSTLLRADAGSATVDGFDVAAAAGRGARGDQPHRAVRGRRRDPHRSGERGAGGAAAAPPRRRPDRRRRCSPASG